MRCAVSLAAVVFVLAGLCGPGLAKGVPIRYEIYMVCRGDTVENIAARFGVEAARIRAFNNLSDDAVLTPGLSLAVILAGEPVPEESQEQGSLDAWAGASAEMTEPREIPPRYAVVVRRCNITGERGGDVLYQPETGSRVIVKWEQGDYWGVVMQDGSQGWIPKSALQMTQEGISPAALEAVLQGGRPDIVAYAMRFLGTPYRYGGRLPHNTDCSLFVQTVFGAHGIRLPRTAAAQAEIGRPVRYHEMVPGDRLYFVNRSGFVNHTGIYVGNLAFIHASSRAGCVAVDSLAQRAYWPRLVSVRRS